MIDLKCRIAISSNLGFSLIEMMIALTLGLLLLESLIMVYLSCLNNYTLQRSLATMQEEGRFVNFYLFKKISQAKYISGSNENGNDVIILDKGKIKFFIAKSSYGADVLYSKTSDNKRSKILADNIIKLHALYGIGCKNQKAICSYLPASKITHWSKVAAITLAILMRSTKVLFFKPRSYQFDGKSLTPSRYLRQEWDLYVAIKSSTR